MRVLCVGRHVFLSEHLCRVFREAGAECEPVVGTTEVPFRAVRFEPHVVVSDAGLLTPSILDAWAREPVLAEVPVLAVSLTCRTEASSSAELHGLAAVIYLPALEAEQVASLLASVHRPRGVAAPPVWPSHTPAPSVHTN